MVVGPPGCGKSTLVSLLIRPTLIDTLDITADYLAAAVFLDITSSLKSLTTELVEQLLVRVPGFGDAHKAVAAELTDEERRTTTSFEREILYTLPRRRSPDTAAHRRARTRPRAPDRAVPTHHRRSSARSVVDAVTRRARLVWRVAGRTADR